MDFLRKILGEWKRDEIYEEYLEAWTHYHQEADGDHHAARKKYLQPYERTQGIDRQKWQEAKMEAVRRLEDRK